MRWDGFELKSLLRLMLVEELGKFATHWALLGFCLELIIVFLILWICIFLSLKLLLHSWVIHGVQSLVLLHESLYLIDHVLSPLTVHVLFIVFFQYFFDSLLSFLRWLFNQGLLVTSGSAVCVIHLLGRELVLLVEGDYLLWVNLELGLVPILLLVMVGHEDCLYLANWVVFYSTYVG